VGQHQLFKLAQDGTITSTAVISAQVTRMLKDPKASRFIERLRREWIGLATFEDSTQPGFDATLHGDMLQETQLFLQDLVGANRNPMALINANYSFLNANLAKQYGVSAPAGTGFQKVTFPAGSHRLGVLTHGSVLAATSVDIHSTHPVKRGHWVTEHLNCTLIAPPPPNIPPLPPTTVALTVRDALNQHVSSPSCIACHETMDVYGLGLENFDQFGKFRTSYVDLNNQPVDPAGRLPNGSAFQTADGLLEVLAGSPQTQTCLSQKFMEMALSRMAMSKDDLCTATSFASVALSSNLSLSDFITRIVLSPQFLAQSRGN
jgi:hypothetical protein